MPADPFLDAHDAAGSNLVWLASYPKSGNTWVRSTLSAYRMADPSRFTFANLVPAANIVNRQWLSNSLGLPTTYLRAEEAFAELPALLEEHSKSLDEVQFIKTHLSYRPGPNDASIFAGTYTRRAVVIVRNPLAIAPSLAHHMRLDLDDAIATMADPRYRLAGDSVRVTTQIPQQLGDWNSHTLGWLEQTDVPVSLVRYEDLQESPEDTVARVLLECGVPVVRERVAAAVAATRFSALRAQEEQHGFRESMLHLPFFRRGESDSWREELSPDQINRVLESHGDVMHQLGYDITGWH